MNKQLCRFAIIRFSPFIETEEFANIGVLIATPKKLIFKLEPRKYARVTSFFDGLDKKVYLNSVKNLANSLKHYSRLSEGEDPVVVANIFEEIIRPRETLLKFSDLKVGLYEDPSESLTELFQYYVERNFVTKEYKEKAMEIALRDCLKEANLDKLFVKDTLSDGMYKTTFPFVKKDENITRVIKPLNIHQENPSAIIDSGGKWVFKVKQLRARGIVDKDILFTIDDRPSSASEEEAYSEVKKMFSQEGILLKANSNKNSVLMFARDGYKAFV